MSSALFIPMPRDDPIPMEEAFRLQGHGPFITYHHWTPIILLCMAAMFCLPRIVWEVLCMQGAYLLHSRHH